MFKDLFTESKENYKKMLKSLMKDIKGTKKDLNIEWDGDVPDDVAYEIAGMILDEYPGIEDYLWDTKKVIAQEWIMDQLY